MDPETFGREASGEHPPNPPPSDRVAEFLELYSANYQRLQFFLMSVQPSEDDVAEVLQETSVVLWQKFEEFEDGSDFFAWACTIARFKLLKHYEGRRRASRLLNEEVATLIAREASEHTGRLQGTHGALDECLEALPDADRKLILQRYQPGSSVTQMAGDLGWTANRLTKCLAKIRRALLGCIQRKMAIESVQ